MSIPNVPLQTLRAFEAAARLGSFEHAAGELNITNSAVSQQIAKLEDKLGLALFTRQHRKVVLTTRGEALALALGDAFTQIFAALKAATEPEAESVRCLVYQTLAAKWLIPALSRLAARWPSLVVEFETGMKSVDFERTDLDLALRFGDDNWPGLRSHKLFDEVLIPVCTPAVAAALGASGLHEACLIHSANRAADWQKWFDAHPHHGMNKARARQLSFSNSTLAYEAAITGNGIALAEIIVAASDIANDKLVVPFKARLVTGRGLYVLEPQQSSSLQAVGLLRQWIIEESALHDVLAKAYE